MRNVYGPVPTLYGPYKDLCRPYALLVRTLANPMRTLYGAVPALYGPYADRHTDRYLPYMFTYYNVLSEVL